jgi:hypothetical protein
MARRWPTGTRERGALTYADEGRAGDAPIVELVKVADAVGDLSKAIDHFAPVVLGSATYTLDVNGQATEQYRAQFQALNVISGSGNQLVIAADTKKGAAPGPGPGSAIVQPGGFSGVNVKGYAWTIYGGIAGDQVTVQALARPIPPNSAGAAMQPGRVLWSSLNQTLTASGSGPVVNAAGYGHLELLAIVNGAVSGANALLSAGLFNLDGQGGQYPLTTTGPLAASGQASEAAAGFGAGPNFTSQAGYGAVTSAAAGGVIAQLPALPPGLYDVWWSIYQTGTLAAADVDNMALTNFGVGTLVHGLVPGIATVPPVQQLPYRVQTIAGEVLCVSAIALATVASVYHAELNATPAGQGQGQVPTPTVQPFWTLSGTTPNFAGVNLVLIGRE